MKISTVGEVARADLKRMSIMVPKLSIISKVTKIAPPSPGRPGKCSVWIEGEDEPYSLDVATICYVSDVGPAR